MEFKTRLQEFVDAIQVQQNEYYEEHYPSLTAPTISIDKGGRKYIRIVRSDPAQRSVHCFVEVATGNILKAAGWSAPAKHSRGNIYNGSCGMSAMSIHGAHYLR